jgi:hypothetical protein
MNKMGNSGSSLEEYPGDFPTDDQVREYAEACLKQYADSTPCESGQKLALDDPEAFMRQFLSRNPEANNMKYLGAGRYEVDYG